MNEVFKDVEGFEGLYSVSNYGNVKSMPKGDGNGYRERLLKQEIISSSHTNYRRVTFSVGGITKRFSVHRLVAKAFIDNIENKPFVNHIDNNGENNFVENLEWCTHSENMIHAQKQGRLFETHSKAGKASGLISYQKSIENLKLFIGKRFGDWTVIDIYGRVGKKNTTYLLCECKCGKTKPVCPTNLTSKKTTGCQSCGMKKAWISRRKA